MVAKTELNPDLINTLPIGRQNEVYSGKVEAANEHTAPDYITLHWQKIQRHDSDI